MRGCAVGTLITFGLTAFLFAVAPNSPRATSEVPNGMVASLKQQNISKSDPIALITGKDQLEVGKAAVYRSTGSAGKSYTWIAVPQKAEAWCYPGLYAKDFSSMDYAPGMLVVPEEEGTITLLLLMVEGDKASVARKEIQVGHVTPPTPPNPPPQPPEPPKPPTPSNTLTAWVVSDTAKLVTSSDLKGQAAKLATAMLEACKTVEQSPSTFTMKTARELLAKLTFDSLPMAERSLWLKWSAALDTQVSALVTSGQIKTPADYPVKAWRPVAEGLQQLK